MRINSYLLIMLISVLGLAISCERSTDSSSNIVYIPSSDMELSPRENAEAETMALYLSRELVAPEYLYQRIKNGLATLREQYLESVPQVGMTHLPMHPPQSLIAGLTAEAIEKIRNGSFDEWNTLNNRFRLSGVDTTSWKYGGSFVRLDFSILLNCRIAGPMYEELENVWSCQCNGYAGDYPNIYAWLDENDKLVLLVRDAWGDCPAGCIVSHFYYFIESDDGFDLEIEAEMVSGSTEPVDPRILEIYNFWRVGY